MLEFAMEVFSTSVDSLAKVKFNKRHSHHRLVVSLYAAIIEQSEALLHLVKLNRVAGTGNLLRSILEAYVDLKLLIREPTYENNLVAKYHAEWIKLLENGLSDIDSLNVAGGSEVVNAKIQEHKVQLKSLKDAGYPKVSIKNAFARTEMQVQYFTLYNSLCAESHNDIRVLVDRHIKTSKDGFELVLFSEPDNDSFALTLDTLAGILIHGAFDLQRNFETGLEGTFLRFDDRLLAFRKKIG